MLYTALRIPLGLIRKLICGPQYCVWVAESCYSATFAVLNPQRKGIIYVGIGVLDNSRKQVSFN